MRNVTLEDALALALKLAPKERLQLIERVASSVEHELTAESVAAQPSAPHWGQALNHLLDASEPITLTNAEIDDPVAWVKHLRAERRRLRDSEDAN